MTVKYNFSDRIAVLTGAAGGFGNALARKLMSCGARVSLWDSDKERLTKLVTSLAAGYGPGVISDTLDITDFEAVGRAARLVMDRWGKIDILINNAGILGPVEQTWDHSVDQFRRVLDVNLTGTFICCRAIVPLMLQNPTSDLRGRIVNVASIQGKEGMPLAAAYSASKAGVIALTKSLGKELAESGILVNAITPAAVLTAMANELTEQRKQDILSRIPMRRFLTSEEVAAQIAWLCSADCSFATGAVFDLSGGRATY